MRVVFVFILIICSLIICPSVQAGTIISFEGVVDLAKERLAVQFGGGETNTVVMDLHRSSTETLTFSFDFRHVKLLSTDFTTVVQGDIRLIRFGSSHREVVGEVRSQYALINRKPVRDAYFKFALRDRKLIIDRVWLGALSGSGEVDLLGEHNTNLTFEIVSSDLEQVFDLFQNTSAVQMPLVSGTLTGAVTLTGPLLKPLIEGRLAAYSGCFKALCYDNILLQMEGVFPNISLNDSALTNADGFNFNLAGSIDLSDLAHLPYQIRQLRKVPIISAARDKREWILKRQRSDVNRDAVTEMKYLWLKDDRGDVEGVLGFEQKIGF